MNSIHSVASWYMKKKNGLLTMKRLGREYGVMPIVVAAAAVVPVSSTSITALCSTCKNIKKKINLQRLLYGHIVWIQWSGGMKTNL